MILPVTINERESDERWSGLACTFYVNPSHIGENFNLFSVSTVSIGSQHTTRWTSVFVPDDTAMGLF